MDPLHGLKVIEMAGLAPGPYCGMLLADFGADVVIVDRISPGEADIVRLMKKNPLNRGKRSMGVNLKTVDGVQIMKRMIGDFDVLIDPFRPGVMEALGLGPEEALEINPGLIFARLTGWGQSGPYSRMAGHDINYIAMSGALSLFRRKGEKPLPPCNLLGDFAGGGMLCALGILLALLERNRSGEGQVVDAAMLDGACNLSVLFWGLRANGLMNPEIGTNALDTGAHFYETYETSDGKFVSVGAIEGKFYQVLLEGLGLDPASLPHQLDMEKWPEMKKRFQEVFKTKTRDEWAAVFEGKDACVAPILEMHETGEHPHNAERGILIDMDGVAQPAPAPRLSRTPGRAGENMSGKGLDTTDILTELGYPQGDITRLKEKGAVR